MCVCVCVCVCVCECVCVREREQEEGEREFVSVYGTGDSGEGCQMISAFLGHISRADVSASRESRRPHTSPSPNSSPRHRSRPDEVVFLSHE